MTMAGVDRWDSGGLFESVTPRRSMLSAYESCLSTRFRFASRIGIEVVHSDSSEERPWIELLFTRVWHVISFFESLGHVN